MQIISGVYKNKEIKTPGGQHTRPTSGRLREALFNICQTYIEGVRFLDLFAGSGAMGLEALSRGASHATFIDNHRESIKCIQANVKNFGVEANTQVIFGDVLVWMDKLAAAGTKFDIIYADPPYESMKGDLTYGQRVVDKIDSGSLLVENGVLFIEDATAAEPVADHLKHLIVKSSRRFGRSMLQQYQNNR